MIRRLLVIALVAIAVYGLYRVSSPATSPPDHLRHLSGEEITLLLSGRTAVGVWGSDAYRQFFEPGGVTYYAPRGKRSTRGLWRISVDGTRYESWWAGPADNWETYGVAVGAAGYVWIEPDGRSHPFEMLDGQQLVWPDS